MPRKKPLSASIECDPEWEIPSTEQLEPIDPGHLYKHVRDNHEGLQRIRLEPVLVDNNNEAIGVVQDFMIASSDRLPEVEPSKLAQIVKARAIRYAHDEDDKIPFRMWLEGTRTTGKPWRKQCQFTIDPHITEDYMDAGDPPDDEDNEEDGYDGADEDHDDDEPDDDDDDDGSQERVNANGRAHAPVHRPNGVARPQAQPSQQQYYEAAESRTLPPTHSLHPSVDIARSQGVDVKPENMQVQLNPDFMLALMAAGEERMARMVSPLMKEMRLGMQAIRRESSRLARESRMTARMVTRAAVLQQQESQKRQDTLEERFIKTHELSASSYENFQLIAQQGWTAFRNSMEEKAETYVRMREYDRALLGQQLDIAHNSNRTSTTGSMLAYAAPIGLAIGAGVMRKRGDEATAKIMETIAKLLAPRHQEEDDDEEEEEDVIDAEAAQAPHASGPTSSTPNGAPSNGAPRRHRWEVSSTPAILGTRELLESLTEEQVAQLKEILPKSAWDAILQAANSQLEQAALGHLGVLQGMVGSDASLQIRVFSILDGKQKTILLKMVAMATGGKPKGRGIPRRPEASAG